jgi:hypothetical protein
MCNNVTEDAGVVVNIPVLHVGDIQLDLWLMTEDSHDLINLTGICYGTNFKQSTARSFQILINLKFTVILTLI